MSNRMLLSAVAPGETARRLSLRTWRPAHMAEQLWHATDRDWIRTGR